MLYTRYWYYIEYVSCKETVVMMYSFYMYKQNMKNGQQQVLLFKNDDDSTTMHFEFHSPLAMFMFLG